MTDPRDLATSAGGTADPASPTRAGVRETFERIAADFARTRQHAWPEVEAFLADRTGTFALDVGSGNGRHCPLLAERAERAVAVDASRALLARVDAPRTDRLQGDASRLPLARDVADIALYVATLHHLPSPAARRGSLDELARVLAPGGRALVSAWSTAHERFDREASFDATIDWTLPDGETVPRFHHVFAPGDFRALLEESALRVVEWEVSSGNCYATVGPDGKST